MLASNINLENKTILVTGAAGFIGANLVTELLNTVKGVNLVGLDNMNDYYDVSIKEYRLAEIEKLAETKQGSKWTFIKGNLADKPLIEKIFTGSNPEIVVNLAAQAERYAQYPLDFQPGCGTGYSPLAGFDVLARVIEVVSDMDAAQYYKANIFQPLGMRDTAFHLNEEQKKRLVHVYCRKNGKLVDVTGSKEDLPKKFHFGERYICGAGGLYSTLTDYGAFAQMLQNGGSYRGTQILKPETVQLMRTEAPVNHLEPEPGFVWGLGVKIRQDPVRGGSVATKGTYGWSGAFGTHFFVSPADDLNCVLMLNRSDLDGAGSYISKKVEELVFGTFAGKGEAL